MPAIRNNILMVLAHKTSAELLERKGKRRWPPRSMREVVAAGHRRTGTSRGGRRRAENADAKPKEKKKKVTEVELPVKHVHFSTFIIQ